MTESTPDRDPAAHARTTDHRPVVLITGGGGGLGGTAADTFAARGWRVLATDLAAPADRENVTGMAADVTDADSMAAVGERIRSDFGGRLDAVVTFAGLLGIGPLAEIDPKRVQTVLDVNVLGTLRAVQTAFPMLRAWGGRVILISSETGPQHAMPMNGTYAMSKHAVEAIGDALRRELMFLGLPVVLIQPGPFKTGMTAAIRRGFQESVRPGSPFAAMAAVMGEMAAGEDDKASDPRVLAETVFKAATAGNPRSRYAVGWNLTRRLTDLLPTYVVDQALKALLTPKIIRREAEDRRLAAEAVTAEGAEVRP